VRIRKPSCFFFRHFCPSFLAKVDYEIAEPARNDLKANKQKCVTDVGR
jgi:hypothetical protein